MSVPAEANPEAAAGAEADALDVGNDPASQMAAIFSFLAPEEGGEEAGEGAAQGDAAAAEPGQQQAPAEGAGGAVPTAGEPGARAGGEPAVPADGQPAADSAAAPDLGGGGAEPAAGAVDAASLSDSWASLSTGFEENQANQLKQSALAEVREEYGAYFDRLNMHPRLLVGQEVQSLTGDGKERLRDAADAKDWQEAVKHLLVQEVESRAATKAEDLKDLSTTVHSSIDLFRNNIDLIPGTRQFDKELAEQFAKMATEYELRADGKLIGYSVPVQPLINQLRSQLAAGRAASAPAGQAPAEPSPRAQQAAQQPRTPGGQWTGPQAGITSKAGQSGAGEDNVAAGLMDAFFRQNGISI